MTDDKQTQPCGSVTCSAELGCCKTCRFFEIDHEYPELGDCKNENFKECVFYCNCDEFYISETFGCKFYEVKP